MFPGQSSRYPEMLERLMAAAPAESTRVLTEAAAILGRDLVAHYRTDNAAMFARNRDVQVGVFIVNHVYLRLLQQRDVTADVSLGLSLGEYNHLVHIGALSFADALRVVDARGTAYDAGPDGAMLCVFPMELEELRSIVDRARDHGTLEVANFNSPTQHVLAGERAAVIAAAAILEEECFVECVWIEDRIPMHSSRFAPVATQFRRELERAPWTEPVKPYLPNVLGEFLPIATRDDFIDLLTRHVHQPVRWRESIDAVAERFEDAIFVEVGPRSVLYNLLHRTWRPNRKFKSDHPGDLEAALDTLAEELLRAA